MSGGIRPFVEADLEPVVDLYQRAARSGGTTPAGLHDYFVRTLVKPPWADTEIPSLVYEGDDGRVVGFIGSHVRRARLGERTIRIGCSGQLVSDPSNRSSAIGALLMRAYLAGPQDLSITDGATPLVASMWTRLGGQVLHPASTVWTRILRPTQMAGDRALASAGRSGWRRFTQPVAGLVDRAAQPLVRPPDPEPALEVSELTPAGLVELAAETQAGSNLGLDLDQAFASWAFEELAAARRGRFTARVVGRDGHPLGWYLAYLEPGGTSQVVELAAPTGDDLDRVLSQLLVDAYEAGSIALEGRVDGWLFETVARRKLLMRAGERVLYHTHDPDLERLMATGGSRLSRLTGEWWMAHHLPHQFTTP